jgi:hypothetical protein
MKTNFFLFTTQDLLLLCHAVGAFPYPLTSTQKKMCKFTLYYQIHFKSGLDCFKINPQWASLQLHQEEGMKELQILFSVEYDNGHHDALLPGTNPRL